ncbi:MAG TPA: DinB family protein [Thermoanaerobaculia bacterium]|nr:DinB family protein [Thermoanaerobaculia bacterium]
MRPIERLLEQINAVYGGPAWHGPALRNLLDNVTEEQARAHPVGGGHSILELLAHVRIWMDVAARRVGGEVIASRSVDSWPDLASMSFAGEVAELERAQGRFADAVARLGPDDLDKAVPGKKHTIYAEVHGVLQHNTYHAGQIALLKKALT